MIYKWAKKINSTKSRKAMENLNNEIIKTIQQNNELSLIHFFKTYNIYIAYNILGTNTLNSNIRMKVNWTNPPYIGKEFFWIWKQPFSPYLSFQFYPKNNTKLLEIFNIPVLEEYKNQFQKLTTNQNLIKMIYSN
ncbi:hypothetical protein SSYRP_v1c07720 [Spiroplasma syrphidicola EA-1]|uniref:Uncharacterized protein n=2 Tax=Spiroplasma syrphidicola TaxID=216945 RepID=R4U4F6_9MOLU|nr:hypothetical protein SSYRP_v1c07720 [Spiroplasma syrphidicola EA-1]